MKCALVLCSLSFLYSQICHSANIVAFMPSPFYSHQIAFKPLWLALAKRGHKITLIQPNVIVENNENITHIVLNGTYDILDKYNHVHSLVEGQSVMKVLYAALEAVMEGLEYQLTHPGVQELLKGEKKVDLFFTEFLLTFGFSLGRSLNAPMIGVVSMDTTIEGHMSAGNPTHPVMYPDRDMPYPLPLTLKERMLNTLHWLVDRVMNEIFLNLQDRVASKCLGQQIPLNDIIKNVSLVFINANPLFNVVRPLGPKTVNIGGGVHLMEPQPLPTELQDYLDNARNGVIYFSLGSTISSKHLSNTTKEVILKTFSQLPHDILWKFDEEIVSKPKNMKIMRWTPQQDLLRHKNIKLFITQGGLQSVEEAIFNYVPMIVLPFFGDQHNNAEKMVARGFGLTLDHNKLDVRTFRSAILEVINNPKYRERTKESADLVMDQPMSGLEKAVWWTEYVLRHGQTDHFRNTLSDIPWYQFLLLDVILCFLVITVIVAYVSFKLLQLLKCLAYKLYGKLTRKIKTKIN
ncbi:UDP-glucuronosyltransferase 2B16-like isoform X1 [Anoplophora glabripennis]|uniref:UDP-glucuronosyltransferase 2B16-like isoform X1 n=1 Tax=Anoplophora glabripennis TaxID=217634 RepID=UPI000875A3A3|nr:UDP-glucuronosyltransferase 2B16-like isoform X1 [Anoplophora glabripennis]